MDRVGGVKAKGIGLLGDFQWRSSMSQRVWAAQWQVGRKSRRRSRASWLGLVEDLGWLTIWPAAMFYLVPTQCFIYFF